MFIPTSLYLVHNFTSIVKVTIKKYRFHDLNNKNDWWRKLKVKFLRKICSKHWVKRPKESSRCCERWTGRSLLVFHVSCVCRVVVELRRSGRDLLNRSTSATKAFRNIAIKAETLFFLCSRGSSSDVFVFLRRLIYCDRTECVWGRSVASQSFVGRSDEHNSPPPAIFVFYKLCFIRTRIRYRIKGEEHFIQTVPYLMISNGVRFLPWNNKIKFS